MLIAIACLLTFAAVVYVLMVRPSDLPETEPVSPFAHLDERKASIYENLRDLQFEYRVGKLSDADYQATKKDLQRELSVVMAEIDQLKQKLGVTAAAVPAPAPPKPAAASTVCPHCGAKFPKAMKFCGECGKSMVESA
jgi:hypothetical protein